MDDLVNEKLGTGPDLILPNLILHSEKEYYI